MRLLITIIPLLVLLACEGQSGSEPSCPDPTPCICRVGTQLANPPIRATIVESSGTTVRVRVDEVAGDGYGPDIAPGVEIGGTVRHCGTAPVAHAGDRVVLLYARGDEDAQGCAEYQACVESRCTMPVEGPSYGEQAALYDECITGCQAETATACAARAPEARLNGTVYLAVEDGSAWSFGLDEDGAAIRLEDTELGILRDETMCEARFPAEAVMCTDVIYDGDGSHTATPPPSP